VAIELVLALAPTPAFAAVPTASSVARSGLWLFDGRNGEGGERELEKELTQAVVGDGGDQGTDRIGSGRVRTHRFLP
jgi:hypothetical protein